MKTIDYELYRKKLKRCFLGKTIGGTLGMPYEGLINTYQVTYYNPVPTDMVANDDLDLQVVSLEVIKQYGLPINRYDLAKGFLAHQKGNFDEYGVAIKNIKSKMYPPLSGYCDNKFSGGMGSCIRTEIWACLAPGDPELAVRLAREDAAVDHYGDGILASSFVAALESIAFVENDREKMLDVALSYIDKDSRLFRAVCDVREWVKTEKNPTVLRDMILKKYYCQNWTDTTINLAFVVMAWYLGDGDFEKSICTVAGLGHDSDCTTGILGSILGLIMENEPDKKWTAPIGDKLVVSSCIVGIHESSTIDEFCQEISDLSMQVLSFYKSDVQIIGKCEKKNKDVQVFANADVFAKLEHNKNLNVSTICVRPLIVEITYPESISLAPDETGKYGIKVKHPFLKSINGKMRLSAPNNWKIDKDVIDFQTNDDGVFTTSVEITAPNMGKKIIENLLCIRFEVSGLCWDVYCGLKQTMDFISADLENVSDVCPKLSELKNKEKISFYQCFNKIGEEGRIFYIDFCASQFHPDSILIAQGNGPVKAWIDEKLVLSHDGFNRVPAFHRSDCISNIGEIDDSWHTLAIWIGKDVKREENNPENSRVKFADSMPLINQIKKYAPDTLFGSKNRELFFGFGERPGWQWINEIVWNIPEDYNKED